MAEKTINSPSYPGSVVPEVASLILNGIGMLELSEEAYLLEYVLPLLHCLLAQIGHLFDGDDLLAEQTSGVVDSAEAAMADLSQILEDLLRVVLLEELGGIRVLEAPGPRRDRHNLAVAGPAQALPPPAPTLVVARLDFQLRVSSTTVVGAGSLPLDPNLSRQLTVLCRQSITLLLLAVGCLACERSIKGSSLHSTQTQSKFLG